MPNHFHGILFLGAVVDEDQVALPSLPPQPSKSPTLGEVVRAFKSITAINSNKILGRTGAPFWQRNYYERIIRNDASLDRIRGYIANNPANWAQDEENPERR